ncbi:hypothetical protein EJ110_NYTH38289 [Nymphaea thermarum]|nr:hypothetical protein EJ110_NYTH38289 [Nymphaea thermarum]
MWVILEQMYGQKKKAVRVYQLMKDVYSLRQDEHSATDFYAALKSKWKELDYYSNDTWDCPQDQVRHLAKEWENRVFLFLAGLNNDFEGIRSQILNSDGLPSIEDVYARVEDEEQKRLVTVGKKGDHISYNEMFALVSHVPVGAARPPHKNSRVFQRIIGIIWRGVLFEVNDPMKSQVGLHNESSQLGLDSNSPEKARLELDSFINESSSSSSLNSKR